MELDAPHTLSAFFQHLLQLKRDGLDNLPGYVEAGAMHILNLKQVHRELCEATEGLRESTAEAKSQLDQSSLQLQNLLYEQQHYEKEIASCRAYKSAFPGAVMAIRGLHDHDCQDVGDTFIFCGNRYTFLVRIKT